jgi:hypothetical protein
MKKRPFLIYLITLFFGLMFLQFASSAVSDSMVVEANVFAQTISIEVPDHVFLGNVTRGFSADYVRIDMNNTGTTDVKITPQLEDSSEKIFNYTYFARRTTEDFYRIGNFSINILKPSSIGGKRSEYCYVKLDLTDYPYDINQNLIGYKSNVIFWATSY